MGGKASMAPNPYWMGRPGWFDAWVKISRLVPQGFFIDFDENTTDGRVVVRLISKGRVVSTFADNEKDFPSDFLIAQVMLVAG